MFETPGAFARGTVEREGERGAAWLAELSGIVADLLERWECVPDGEVMHGGVGVIVPVRPGIGDTTVFKVSFPQPGNVHEPDALAAWGGRGAVALHERDDDRFAMLLERAQASTLAEVGDEEEVVTVAGRISHRLAVPAPPGPPRLREQADAWEEQVRKDAEDRRWAQFHAVQAAFWGRRHGFRTARGGPRLDWLTEFADRAAELLTTRRPGS